MRAGKKGACSYTQGSRIVLSGNDATTGQLWISMASEYPCLVAKARALALIEASCQLFNCYRCSIIAALMPGCSVWVLRCCLGFAPQDKFVSLQQLGIAYCGGARPYADSPETGHAGLQHTSYPVLEHPCCNTGAVMWSRSRRDQCSGRGRGATNACMRASIYAI